MNKEGVEGEQSWSLCACGWGDKKQISTEGLETEVRTAGESQRRTENQRGGDRQRETLRSRALSAFSSQATGRTEGSPQEGCLQSLEPLSAHFPHLQTAHIWKSAMLLFPRGSPHLLANTVPV